MGTRAQDARSVDVAAAAAASAVIAGDSPLAGFERLADGRAIAADAPGVVWSGRFERRTMRGGEPEARLHLDATAQVTRECQRCLQPVTLALNVDRDFRFAADERAAAALDIDSDDDVLVQSRRFDLLELVEDELLLALPLVPKHAQCPQPLTAAEEPEPAAHPFAALAALKRGRGS